MADDVVLNKVAAIERAIGRVRQGHAGDDRNLLGEAFDLLQGAGLVDPLLTEKMKNMVGSGTWRRTSIRS